MSDGFLVLAQTRSGPEDQGLTCLFVPRTLSHAAPNVFRIQRLKDKLGNRSNASAEIELDGTVGLLVGEPGRGVRTIIEMVQRTRLDCVIRNLSDGGAKLEVPTVRGIPDHFDLLVPRHRPQHQAAPDRQHLLLAAG